MRVTCKLHQALGALCAQLLQLAHGGVLVFEQPDRLLLELELLHQLRDAQPLLLQLVLLLPQCCSYCNREKKLKKLKLKRVVAEQLKREHPPLSASLVFLSSLACSASMAACN
jgi:hypothetical protein